MSTNLKAKYELLFTANGELLIKTADGVRKIGDEATRSEDKVQRLSSRLKTIGGGLDKMAGFSRRFAVATTAIGVGIGGLAYKAVSAAGEVEAIHTQLLTLFEGDAVRADRAMEWVEEFSATTPFEMKNVAQATVLLEAYGLTAEKWLPMVGDMAAAMNRDVTETAVAVGKAVASGGSGMDALRESYALTNEQIKEAGWNGKTGAEGIESFGAALTKVLSEGKFAGGMERLSHTFQGLVSNIKDMVFQLSAEVGAPLLEIIKEDLRDILQRVKEMKESGEWDQWVEKMSDFFKQFYEGAKEIGGELGKMLKWVVEMIDKNPELAKFVTKLATLGPVVGTAGAGIFKMAAGVTKLIGNLSGAMGSGGVMEKFTMWSRQQTGAVSQIDPSRATGVAGSSQVGKGVGTGMAGIGYAAAAAASILMVTKGIERIVEGVDHLVVTEAELHRGRVASLELQQHLEGIIERRAEREDRINQIVRDVNRSITDQQKHEISLFDHVVARFDKLVEEKGTLQELVDLEQERIDKIEKQQKAMELRIAGDKADLFTATGQMDSMLSTMWGTGGMTSLGQEVMVQTGFDSEGFADQIRNMSESGNFEGILDISNQLASVEKIAASDDWPQLRDHLMEAATAAENLHDSFFEAGRQLAEQMNPELENISSVMETYQKLATKASEARGEEAAMLQTILDRAEQLALVEKTSLENRVRSLGVLQQSAIYGMMGNFGAEGLKSVEGLIAEYQSKIDLIEEGLTFDPLAVDVNETTTTTSGGKSSGPKQPAVQYVNSVTHIHIGDISLDPGEDGAEGFINELQKLADSGFTANTTPGGA